MNYDAKWIGYNQTVTFKTMTQGRDYVVRVNERHITTFRSAAASKAFFTGIITMIRDEQIS